MSARRHYRGPWAHWLLQASMPQIPGTVLEPLPSTPTNRLQYALLGRSKADGRLKSAKPGDLILRETRTCSKPYGSLGLPAANLAKPEAAAANLDRPAAYPEW